MVGAVLGGTGWQVPQLSLPTHGESATWHGADGLWGKILELESQGESVYTLIFCFILIESWL